MQRERESKNREAKGKVEKWGKSGEGNEGENWMKKEGSTKGGRANTQKGTGHIKDVPTIARISNGK